ncbi:hypothetical protein QVD17_23907 [Tagetes erecta]|uniref:ENTH domain-containing protein n=1 Tax=Tagetes erecta TaxID=13708 RepID=A0AAD8KJL0_TARER|nr:hypothetical protein QVD17_23907 [Tagetes erecta]
MKDLNLIGIFKDKLTLSKLTFLTNSPLHIAVLRTTTHSPSSPPTHHHLTTLLSLGDSSRATASILTTALINRLHRTTNPYVALKSLFTIHHIIKHGPFILKDQLSVFISSTNIGRNHFKLNNFNECKSATTWMLSAWVRWYASYIENILHTSKNMSFVISSLSLTFLEREKQQEMISSYINFDLIKDFASLTRVIEEMCKVPDNILVENDRLLKCIMEALVNDYLSIVNEIVVRVVELKERVSLLSFNDSVELSNELNRLMSCKEKSLQLFCVRKQKESVDTLWEMVEELNGEIGMVSFSKQLGRKSCNGTESARFGDRVLRTGDSVKFASGRLRLK